MPETKETREPNPVTIVKHFKTLRKAESFHTRLYDKFENVKCVRCPAFEEDGLYVWEVQ